MVVIGQNTYEMVPGQFECKSLGSFTLKGKAQEVSVFQVLALARPEAAGCAGGPITWSRRRREWWKRRPTRKA
jgi:class 3 adenylate cyclase